MIIYPKKTFIARDIALSEVNNLNYILVEFKFSWVCMSTADNNLCESTI